MDAAERCRMLNESWLHDLQRVSLHEGWRWRFRASKLCLLVGAGLKAHVTPLQTQTTLKIRPLCAPTASTTRPLAHGCDVVKTMVGSSSTAKAPTWYERN